MFTKRIELQEGTVVEITGHSDLSVHGVEERVLAIEISEEEEEEASMVAIRQEAGKVGLEFYVDAQVQVWKDCRVVVPIANGDLSLRELGGALEIGEANGDVALVDVGEVKVSRVDGDLRLRGRGAAVEVAEAEGDVTLAHVGAVQLGRLNGDLSISRGETVRAPGSLNADVYLRGVGAVELTTVCGDLHVSRADSLVLERVESDLTASIIAGEVRLQVVQGDATLRDIGGAVAIGKIEGDLSVRGIRGDLAATQVGGDVDLDIAFRADQRYTVASNDDISVRIPTGTAARFTIQAPRSEWAADAGFQVESQEAGRAIVRLGQGGPDVYLAADGEVTLGSSSGEWEQSLQDFGRRMESWGLQFGQQMEEWGEQVRKQVDRADWERVGKEIEEATGRVVHLVETRLEEIDLDEMSRRASAVAGDVGQRVRQVDWERIGHKVEEATRQGMQRVQTGLSRLRERLEREGHMVPPVPPQPPVPPVAPVPPVPPVPPLPGLGAVAAGTVVVMTTREQPAAAPDPVTDEERMAVLQLVEEGRLSSEEAAALLDALDELDAS